MYQTIVAFCRTVGLFALEDCSTLVIPQQDRNHGDKPKNTSCDKCSMSFIGSRTFGPQSDSIYLIVRQRERGNRYMRSRQDCCLVGIR